MSRGVVRWVLFTIALAISLTSNPFERPLKPFDPLSSMAAPGARAEEATAEPTLTPTGTPVLTPVPILAVTPAPTSEPVDAESPPETETPLPAVETPTQTPVPTPEVSPTATPEPMVEEPAPPGLSERPAGPGASVEMAVAETGGTVTSADGRVSVEFPAAAVAEPLVIKITYLDTNELPPLPNQPFVMAWELEAFAPDRGMAKVESFPAEATLKVRHTAEDLIGLDSRTLRLWTLNEETGEWVPVPASLDSKTGAQTAPISHFSVYGEGGEGEGEAGEMAPYLHDYEVGLHSGTATTSIPIEVPPGPGGLTPSLTLTYDSGRVDAMKNYWYSIGSWVGIGWDLTTGSIKKEGSRYFLEMDGVATQILGPGFKNEQFLRIDQEPYGLTVKWTVTDKSGTTYTFGGTDDSARYTGWSPYDYYQWDLSSITDTHGNVITYTYDQVIVLLKLYEEDSFHVRSSYPQEITYAGDTGDKVKIRFNTGFNETCIHEYGGDQQELEVRYDTPVNTSANPTSPYFTETRYLDSVEVLVHEDDEYNLVRKYQFEYVTEPHEYGHECPIDSRLAGEHKLVSLSLLDRDGEQALYTSTFEYQDLRFGYRTELEGDGDYEYELWRPYLTLEENGFGGQTEFTYDEKWKSVPSWTREAVVQKKLTVAADQQEDVTTYFDYTDPGSPTQEISGPVYVDGEFRGFAYVKEIDAASDWTRHHFNTGDPLVGREMDTEVYNHSGVRRERAVNGWSYRDLGDDRYFVYLSAVHRYLGETDDVHTLTEYDYDDIGNQTQVIERGDIGVGGAGDDGQQKVTEREFHQGEGDDYIVVPKWERAYHYGDNPEIPENILARAYYYYDGSSDNAHQPIEGNLTAVSQQVDHGQGGQAPAYSTVYRAYDVDNGNKTGESMPTFNTPSDYGDQGPGWLPPDVAKTTWQYENEYDTYPMYITLSSPDPGIPDQTTELEYDYVLGKVTKRTEPNGRVVETLYDDFGRPLYVWDNLDPFVDEEEPYGEPDFPTKKYDYHWEAGGEEPSDDYNWTTTWQRSEVGDDGAIWQTTCYDGFGRQVKAISPLDEDTASVVDTFYNSQGLIGSVTNAYEYEEYSGGCPEPLSAPKTIFFYNTILWNKVTKHPDNKTRTETYTGLTTTVKDENTHKTVSVQNAFDRTAKVEEYLGTFPPPTYQLYATTTYEYDPLGNLTVVTDALGNETEIEYDMLGRKTAMDDMDMGQWSYEYDAAGKLSEQTDAKGIVTHLDYDDLGRLEEKRYFEEDDPEETDIQSRVAFYYDSYYDDDPSFCSQDADTAIGQLTKMEMEDGSSTTYWCYDERGRVVGERKTIDDADYDITHTYDSADRATQTVYPDDELLESQYDPVNGLLTGLHSHEQFGWDTWYVSDVTYTANFRPESFTLGNGLTTDYTYDNRSRVKTIQTGTVQDLTYEYDGVSNVTEITDATVSPEEVIEYSYDELNRLKTASTNPPETEYVYDEIGRIIHSPDYDYYGVNEYQYDYDDHVHAVSEVLNASQNPTDLFLYDANGNLTYNAFSGAYTYTYDAENRLTSRPWSYDMADYDYTYDGQGNLVKRVFDCCTWPPTTSDTIHLYVGDLYEQRSYRDSQGETLQSRKNYYWAFGRRIAYRSRGASPDEGSVYYLLADHLGSTNSVLNSSGAVVQDIRYDPYGDRRRGSGYNYTDRQFTSQQKEPGDDTLLLYNYGARFYSTKLGRFLSADPLVAGTGGLTASPQSLDGFSYVLNNPLRYCDPTGLCFKDPYTGEDLPCSEHDLIRWSVCAHSPSACKAISNDQARWGHGPDPSGVSDWDAMSRMAGYGVSTSEFRHNWRHGKLPLWTAKLYFKSGPGDFMEQRCYKVPGWGVTRCDMGRVRSGPSYVEVAGFIAQVYGLGSMGADRWSLGGAIVGYLGDLVGDVLSTPCGRATATAFALCIGTTPEDPLCAAAVAGAVEVCNTPSPRFEGE